MLPRTSAAGSSGGLARNERGFYHARRNRAPPHLDFDRTPERGELVRHVGETDRARERGGGTARGHAAHGPARRQHGVARARDTAAFHLEADQRAREAGVPAAPHRGGAEEVAVELDEAVETGL